MTMVAAATPRRTAAARAQERATELAVEEATRRIAPIIDAALERVAERFLSTVVAAGKPIDKSDTQPIETYWAEEAPGVAQALSHVYVGTTNVVMQQLGGTRSVTEGLRDTYLTNATNRLNDVGKTLWSEAANTLAEGNLAGESYDQLRDRLKETFAAGGKELGDTRAVRIARTEVQSAVNRGTLDGVKTMNTESRPRYKTWLATLGPQTREAHAEADGQTVLLEESFEVDGELLEFPGDPVGSPGNIINCRCTIIYGDDPDGLEGASDRQMTLDYCGDCSDCEPSALVAAAFEGPEEGFEVEDWVDPAEADELAYCQILDDATMQSTDARTFANDSEASRAWVDEHYGDWVASIDETDAAYIKQYTQDVYDDVNGALRRAAREDVDLSVWEGMTSSLDRTLARTSTPDDVMVFRQVTDLKDNPFWGSLRVGDEFIDHGYVSTSLSNPDPFGLSVSGTSPAYTSTNFRITVPKGSQGGPLAQVGGKTGDELALALREDEFLLPRGTTFRVKNVASDGSLDLEVIA